MVEIQLDKKYWLWSDKHQWVIGQRIEGVYKIGKHIGEDYTTWKGELFLHSLSYALQVYYDRSLKESRATSWEQLIKDSNKLKERIDKILQRIEKIRVEVK